MNNQDAKFILRAYRPGGADAGDATFCEALEHAKRDPELGRWLAREQALDGAVAAKLRGVAVPAGLRAAILAGGRVSGARRSWWTQPTWLALAASLVLLVAATTWALRLGGGVPLERMVAFAVADLKEPRHGAVAPTSREMAAWLADPAVRLAQGVAFDMDRLSAMGCRTMTISGRRILEVCFVRDGVEFHLFVLERGSGLPAARGPEFAEVSGVRTMAWTDEKYAYVVAGEADEARLRALL